MRVLSFIGLVLESLITSDLHTFKLVSTSTCCTYGWCVIRYQECGLSCEVQSLHVISNCFTAYRIIVCICWECIDTLISEYHIWCHLICISAVFSGWVTIEIECMIRVFGSNLLFKYFTKVHSTHIECYQFIENNDLTSRCLLSEDGCWCKTEVESNLNR